MTSAATRRTAGRSPHASCRRYYAAVGLGSSAISFLSHAAFDELNRPRYRCAARCHLNMDALCRPREGSPSKRHRVIFPDSGCVDSRIDRNRFNARIDRRIVRFRFEFPGERKIARLRKISTLESFEEQSRRLNIVRLLISSILNVRCY